MMMTDEDLERYQRFARKHQSHGGRTDILATQVSALVNEVLRLRRRVEDLEESVRVENDLRQAREGG